MADEAQPHAEDLLRRIAERAIRRKRHDELKALAERLGIPLEELSQDVDAEVKAEAERIVSDLSGEAVTSPDEDSDPSSSDHQTSISEVGRAEEKAADHENANRSDLFRKMDNPTFIQDAQERLEAHLDEEPKLKFKDALKIWAGTEIPSTLSDGSQNPDYAKARKLVKQVFDDYCEKRGLECTKFKWGRGDGYSFHLPDAEPDTRTWDPNLGPAPPEAEDIAEYILSLGGDLEHSLGDVIEGVSGEKIRSKIPGSKKQNPCYMQWKSRVEQARAHLATEKGIIFEQIGSGPNIRYRVEGGSSPGEQEGGEG